MPAPPREIHQTAYLRLVGCASEAEAKRRARDEGRITYHAHVGASTWSATAEDLRLIETTLAERGWRCDRFGLTLSRAMSVTADHRAGVLKETGPILDPTDWDQLGEAAAIQPHLGDFMIGTPAGLEHTVLALRAGVTTIGNLGQYFAFELPGQDVTAVTDAAVAAISVLAAWRDRGALVHSYLDDGPAMQASHYGAYLGWAALERYVVETLCGARLAHAWGGLVDDPWHRAVVHLALDDVHDRDQLGSMVYGNTVDMRAGDRAHNLEVLTRYLEVDLSCQLHRPTGHAVHPVPLTEAERVPTGAENAEVQLIAHALEQEVRRRGQTPQSHLERVAGEVSAFARAFRVRVLAKLEEDGVAVADPAAMLAALRERGMDELETRVNLRAPANVAALVPWKARHVAGVVDRLRLPRLDGVRVILAVLDVHDVVRDALAAVLPRQGAQVIVLAADTTPRAVIGAAVDEDADAVLVGTYNGAALSIGRTLRDAAGEIGYDGAIIMGGRLNETAAARRRTTSPPRSPRSASSRLPRWTRPPARSYR